MPVEARISVQFANPKLVASIRDEQSGMSRYRWHSGTIDYMIYLLVGENVFQRDSEIAKLTAGRAVERHLGPELAPEHLGEVLAGQTLFSADTLTIIDQASLNKPVWEVLPAWLDRSSQSGVILVETKLDKRTKTYKQLQRQATVINCDYWTDRQRSLATRWLSAYAGELAVAIPTELIVDMVERAIRPSDVTKDAIIDQQRLARAVEQLQQAEVIDRATLDTVLAPSVHENIFRLLTQALDGDVAAVQAMIPSLRREQDGHRVMGLLSSQLANLVALVLADSQSAEQVASDIGVHPFALRQLSRYRTRFDRSAVAMMVGQLADADRRLKRSQAEPWLLIEKALVEIAARQKATISG